MLRLVADGAPAENYAQLAGKTVFSAQKTVVELLAASGDIDVAVVAYGVLGDPERAWQEPGEAARIASVNYRAALLTVLLGGVDVLDLDLEDLRRWLARMRDQGLSRATAESTRASASE